MLVEGLRGPVVVFILAGTMPACGGRLGSDSAGAEVSSHPELPAGSSSRPSGDGGLWAIATGPADICALRSPGTVECRANDVSATLGNGMTEKTSVSTTPFAPVPRASRVVGVSDATALVIGVCHACVLRHGGTVACWGCNEFGQLGNGTTTPAPGGVVSPVAIPNLTNVVSVAAGIYHTCVLAADGAVSCWGRNEMGQLGDGTLTDSSIPVKANVGRAVAIAAGNEVSCAVLPGGTAECWGDDGALQLSNPFAAFGGTSGANPSPIRVPAPDPVVAIAIGSQHACLLLSGGRVACWGYDNSGQIGDGRTAAVVRTPQVVPNVNAATAVVAGDAHTCALDASGSVWCWGDNRWGELGTGLVTPFPFAVPNATRVGDISRGWAIAAGGNNTCALDAQGYAACWGDNELGQLGVPTDTCSPSGGGINGLPCSGSPIPWMP